MLFSSFRRPYHVIMLIPLCFGKQMDKKLYTARLSHLMVDAIHFIICISIVMFASNTYGVCINVEHISVSVERRQLLCYVCALKEAKQTFFLMEKTLGLITFLPQKNIMRNV